MKNKNIDDEFLLVKDGKLTLLGLAFILDIHESIVKHCGNVIFNHIKRK